MKKSERPTLFITAVGLNAEELDYIAHDLQQSGFSDKYRPIFSNTPIQAMNEVQMAQLLDEWLDDPEQLKTNESRFDILQNHTQFNSRAWEEMRRYVSELQENLRHIEIAFDKLSNQVKSEFTGHMSAHHNFGNYSPNIDTNPYNALHSNVPSEINKLANEINLNTPHFGQKW